jgi:predicted transcriptional regulator
VHIIINSANNIIQTRKIITLNSTNNKNGAIIMSQTIANHVFSIGAKQSPIAENRMKNMAKIKGKRTTFQSAVEKTLDVIENESPVTITGIADITGTDWRAINRAIDFLLELQDEFAAIEIKTIEGKWGKVVWARDRVDKMKLPEDVREWYIKKRFFNEGKFNKSGSEIDFESDGRTSMEEVIQRIFETLEREDDLTISEIARRVIANRKTVSKALDLIVEIQDRMAKGLITKKEMIIWRARSPLHELDKTTLKLLLKKRYFPNEAEEITEEQERALFLTA